MIRAIALALTLAAIPVGASAQRAPGLICTFDSGFVTDLDERPSPEIEDGAPLLLMFRDIDFNAGTATIIGNIAPEGVPVMAIGGANAFSFLEITPSGNINTTTVFPQGGTNTVARAVHSRHITFGGATPVISQLFGTCRRD